MHHIIAVVLYIEMWVMQNESGMIISYKNVIDFDCMSCG